MFSFFCPVSHPQKQNRRKSLRPAADPLHAAIMQPLAGGESSFSYKPRETFAVLAPLVIPLQGRPRKTRRPSGQVAETPPKASRVRFEFAGRAHYREFTPNSVINLPLLVVNMKSPKNPLYCKRIFQSHSRIPSPTAGGAPEFSPARKGWDLNPTQFGAP